MPIVENPLRYLIIALFLLMGMLIFFKIADFLRAKSEKKSKKQEEKNKNTVKNEKTSSDKQAEKKTDDKKEVVVVEDTQSNLSSNGYNYLHDRFVDNPTNEDLVAKDENSSMFLTTDEYERIRNEKIKIKVKENNELGRKIDDIIKGDNSERERLLDEFNNLSKEMKLLLIENILKNN